MKLAFNVAMLIERYFTDRLIRQRNASPNTIASYRDTFRLLLRSHRHGSVSPLRIWHSRQTESD
jgi:hypothetical protein